MGKFVSIHVFPVPVTRKKAQEMTIQGREGAKASGKVKFLEVWAQIISDKKPGRMYSKAYCLWEAPDIDSIMEVIGTDIPVEGIYPVLPFKPEELEGITPE